MREMETKRSAILLVSLAIAAYVTPHKIFGQQKINSQDLAAVIEKVQTATVQLQVDVPNEQGGTDLSFGTGSIIHEAGFVLTCNHVVRTRSVGRARYSNGKVVAFRVFARIPELDAALLLLEDSPSASISIGDSSKIQEGSLVFSIANLDGRGLSAIEGRVVGRDRDTQTDHVSLGGLYLVNTSLMPGASGAPLLDGQGRQVAYILSGVTERAGFGFAVPIHKLEEVLLNKLSFESFLGTDLGVKLSSMTEKPTVTLVTKDTITAQAGLEVGDEFETIGDWNVKTRLEAHLALLRLGYGNPDISVPATVNRKGQRIAVRLKINSPQANAADQSEKRVAAGCNLHVRLFNRNHKEIAVLSGRSSTLNPALRPISGTVCEVVASGYIRIPADGSYMFMIRPKVDAILTITDKLSLRQRLDNLTEVNSQIFLKAGLHPFELRHAATANAIVVVENRIQDLQPIPDTWLVTDSTKN